MSRTYLLIVTALAEGGTGLLLLLLPEVPLALLLGVDQAAPEALFIARVAGAALLAVGVASWLARCDERNPAQLGLLAGVLIYDVAAAALLAYAGVILSMVGIALWPAVVAHVALAIWCVWSLRKNQGRERCGDRAGEQACDRSEPTHADRPAHRRVGH